MAAALLAGVHRAVVLSSILLPAALPQKVDPFDICGPRRVFTMARAKSNRQLRGKSKIASPVIPASLLGFQCRNILCDILFFRAFMNVSIIVFACICENHYDMSYCTAAEASESTYMHHVTNIIFIHYLQSMYINTLINHSTADRCNDCKSIYQNVQNWTSSTKGFKLCLTCRCNYIENLHVSIDFIRPMGVNAFLNFN